MKSLTVLATLALIAGCGVPTERASAQHHRAVVPVTVGALPTARTAARIDGGSVAFPALNHQNHRGDDQLAGDVGEGEGSVGGEGEGEGQQQNSEWSVSITAALASGTCTPGSDYTLSWDIGAYNPADCVLTDRHAPIGADLSSGSQDVSVTQCTTFILFCDDCSGHTDSDQVIVDVPVPVPTPTLSFDVQNVTPGSVDFTWTSTAAKNCTLADGPSVTSEVSVGPNGQNQVTSGTGLVTYTLRCETDDALSSPMIVTRSVFWGDATSVQDIIGARAVVGSLLAHGDDFITDFTNNDLLAVAGNFEITNDPNGGLIALSFPALVTIGSNLVIVDNAGFSSVSFASLAAVGNGVDFTGNANLTTLSFPTLSSMNTASSFAAAHNASLSCNAIIDTYCNINPRGVAVVLDNASATCDTSCM